MGVFAQLADRRTPPPGTVVVPPSAWAMTWDERPREDVVVGIRPLSESDLVFCRTEAMRLVTGWYDDRLVDAAPDGEYERVLAYNDALMRLAVARGTCDPNDAALPWDVWGKHGGDDRVREALTPEGTKMLWDALERTTLSVSPVGAQATDEEIEELSEKAARSLAKMPRWQAQRVRRLLRWCLDECLDALGEPPAV